MSAELLQEVDNRPSGLRLDASYSYRPARPSSPRMFLSTNRPQHVPAYRAPPRVVREVAEWDRDLRMLMLEGIGALLFLVVHEAGGHPISRVANAAIAALLVVLALWLGVRWFAFLSRQLGGLLAFVLAGGAPVVVSVVNTAVYHVAPPLFRWPIIAAAWFIAVGVAFGLVLA